VQPVEYVEAAQSDDSVWTYAAAGALLVGAAAVYRGQQQERTGVAEPDLEAASDAMRVAMLFSSGRSSGKKAPARGKKAPAKRKAPARGRAPAAADSDDLFVHEGTKGFTGDQFAFVYRTGSA